MVNKKRVSQSKLALLRAFKKKPLTKEAIEKMTVPKLKAALKKEKVNDLTGKKADLKARLLEKLGL